MDHEGNLRTPHSPLKKNRINKQKLISTYQPKFSCPEDVLHPYT